MYSRIRSTFCRSQAAAAHMHIKRHEETRQRGRKRDGCCVQYILGAVVARCNAIATGEEDQLLLCIRTLPPTQAYSVVVWQARTRVRLKHQGGQDTHPPAHNAYSSTAPNTPTSAALPPTHRVHLHLQQGVLPNEVLDRVRKLQRVQQGQPRHRRLEVVLAPPDHEGSGEDGHRRTHELDAYVEPPEGLVVRVPGKGYCSGGGIIRCTHNLHSRQNSDQIRGDKSFTRVRLASVLHTSKVALSYAYYFHQLLQACAKKAQDHSQFV